MYAEKIDYSMIFYSIIGQSKIYNLRERRLRNRFYKTQDISQKKRMFFKLWNTFRNIGFYGMDNNNVKIATESWLFINTQLKVRRCDYEKVS
jgi:hypothetical protein